MTHDDIARIMNPPIVLGRGYFIMDLRPGAINFHRRLYDGNPPRPLKALAAFERSL